MQKRRAVLCSWPEEEEGKPRKHHPQPVFTLLTQGLGLTREQKPCRAKHPAPGVSHPPPLCQLLSYKEVWKLSEL